MASSSSISASINISIMSQTSETCEHIRGHHIRVMSRACYKATCSYRIFGSCSITIVGIEMLTFVRLASCLPAGLAFEIVQSVKEEGFPPQKANTWTASINQ